MQLKKQLESLSTLMKGVSSLVHYSNQKATEARTTLIVMLRPSC